MPGRMVIALAEGQHTVVKPANLHQLNKGQPLVQV